MHMKIVNNMFLLTDLQARVDVLLGEVEVPKQQAHCEQRSPVERSGFSQSWVSWVLLVNLLERVEVAKYKLRTKNDPFFTTTTFIQTAIFAKLQKIRRRQDSPLNKSTRIVVSFGNPRSVFLTHFLAPLELYS